MQIDLIIVRQHKRKAMQPIQEAITGREEQGNLSTPYQALVQFYCAFNSDDIAMDNPLGGIKRGWEEIQPIYVRRIAVGDE